MDEVLGQSVLNYHPQKARPRVLQIIKDLRTGKAKGHRRMNIRMLKGKFYDNTYTAVWDSKNKYLGTLVVSKEITQRRKTENELKQALRKTENR